MQHDVDYAVCAGKKNEKSCKHAADKKMVKALDAIPKNKRQRGHSLARNAISTKQKVGLGVGETINEQIGKKIPGFSQAQAFINFCPELIKSCLISIGRVTLPRGRLTLKPACSAKSFGHTLPELPNRVTNNLRQENRKIPSTIIATRLAHFFNTYIENGFCNKIQAG